MILRIQPKYCLELASQRLGAHKALRAQTRWAMRCLGSTKALPQRWQETLHNRMTWTHGDAPVRLTNTQIDNSQISSTAYLGIGMFLPAGLGHTTLYIFLQSQSASHQLHDRLKTCVYKEVAECEKVNGG